MDDTSAGPGQRPGDAEQPRGEPFGRPMPDGGLAEAMPEWLRRPPAWRETTARRGKAAPTPDTSPIDPRTLIGVEDLPDWLQRIAQRPAERPVRAEVAQPPGQRVPIVVDPHRARRAPPQETRLPQSPDDMRMRAVEGTSQLRDERVRPPRPDSVAELRQTGTSSTRSRAVRLLFALLMLGILTVVGLALLTSVI